MYMCTGHGNLSFPLINKILFVVGSEHSQVVILFHPLQTRGVQGACSPQEILDF